MAQWREFLLSPNISNKDYREASHTEQASIRSWWWPWTEAPPIIRSENAFLRRYYEDVESLWWLKRWVQFVNGCKARNKYLNIEIGAKAFDFLAKVQAGVGDTQQGADLHGETAIRDRTYKAMGSFIRQPMRLCATTETSSVFGPDTSVQIMLGHDPIQVLYSKPDDDNQGVFSIIDYNN